MIRFGESRVSSEKCAIFFMRLQSPLAPAFNSTAWPVQLACKGLGRDQGPCCSGPSWQGPTSPMRW